MAVIDINWRPSPKDLRVFAALEVVFFAIASVILLRRGFSTEVAGTIFAVAAVIGTVGLIKPRWIWLVYIAWMAAVFPIGWVVSHLLLAAVFYLIFTPVGLLMRLLGRDPMQRKFDPQAETYWQPRTEPNDPSRYFKQY